jgi:hypothetical protein
VCDDLYQAFDMHASLQAGRGLVDGKMRLQHTCGYPVVPFLLQDKTFVEFYGLSGDLLARVGISDIQSIAQAEIGAKRAFNGYAERPPLEIVNRRDLGMMLVVSPERGDSLFCWGLGFEAGCPYSTATPTSDYHPDPYAHSNPDYHPDSQPDAFWYGANSCQQHAQGDRVAAHACCKRDR